MGGPGSGDSPDLRAVAPLALGRPATGVGGALLGLAAAIGAVIGARVLRRIDIIAVVVRLVGIGRLITIIAVPPVLARRAGDGGDRADDEQAADHVASVDPVMVAMTQAAAVITAASLGGCGAEADAGQDNPRGGRTAGPLGHGRCTEDRERVGAEKGGYVR